MDLDKIFRETSESLRTGLGLALMALFVFMPAIYNYGFIRLFRVARFLTAYSRLTLLFILPIIFSIVFAYYYLILLFGMKMPSLFEWLIPYVLGYTITNLAPVSIFISMRRKTENVPILDSRTRKKLIVLLATLILIGIFSVAAGILFGALCLGVYFAFAPEAETER